MWVLLKVIKRARKNGKLVTYQPGEWIDAEKNKARSWLACGDAVRPDMPGMKIMPGCGVIAAGRVEEIRPRVNGLDFCSGPPSLPYEKNLYWHTKSGFRMEMLGAGFGMLDRWEVAIPLASYTDMARNIGSKKERAQTKAVIRDLRVPYYNIGLIFMRRCQAVQKLLDMWMAETGDKRLAFLRALYTIKPLVQPLLVEWCK